MAHRVQLKCNFVRFVSLAVAVTILTCHLERFASLAGNAVLAKPEKGERNLLDEWRRKNGIVIFALGDSITAGVGLDNPDMDCYAVLFSRMLAKWLAPTRVKLIRHGIPGATTDVGLREIDFVASNSPDLVLLQFGGNDSRSRYPLELIKANLAGMIERLRKVSNVKIMLIVPPFQTPKPDSPVAEAIRALAREANVAMADFDRALHEQEHDFRGWFSPPPTHPAEYSHVIMAKELWDALHRMLGIKRPLETRIGTGVTWLEGDAMFELPIAVSNLSRRLLGAELTVEHADVWHHWAIAIDAESNAECKVKLKPPIARSLKFVRERITAVARCDDGLSWDVKWATWTPALHCDNSAMWLGNERIDGWLEFASYDHVVLGGQRWRGRDDLSFRMRLRRCDDGKLLRMNILVNDDVVIVKPAWDFSCLLFGDCVEVFIDHRPPQEQGKPFFDEDVTMLAMVPGSKVVRIASWSFDEAEPTFTKPSGKWLNVGVEADFTATGYSIELTIPTVIFKGLPAISFDVLVDDTDERGGRAKQMAAFGWANNFRNPSPFALLLLSRPNKMPRWRLAIN
ncbi:MAG: GDSL-type esterase/lipase family protein [Armatimonadota bacterium]|nr:GDSL-type esterase/lipase family protein [Armatimonadota bacterium]MCX7777282.1 GDSL-type esterase/lipase family protein [Armatimonadota bacterium]MDW8024401.1 GDSL-type esterase/lipase family protein [Armatimonadota bacterium]